MGRFPGPRSGVDRSGAARVAASRTSLPRRPPECELVTPRGRPVGTQTTIQDALMLRFASLAAGSWLSRRRATGRIDAKVRAMTSESYDPASRGEGFARQGAQLARGGRLLLILDFVS